jgi:hypothetical protein
VPAVVTDVSTGATDARVSRRVGGAWQSLGNANDSSSRLQEFQCPTIAMGAGDLPFVAFNSLQGRSGSGELRQVVRRLNGVTWETVREIQASNFTDRIQVVGDNAGRPVIVWSGLILNGDHRLNVERFNGTDWTALASGFGSLGGQGVGDYRIAVRPDNEVVIATLTGTGPFSSALMAIRVNDSGAVTLGDGPARLIDQVADTTQVVSVLDVAANGTETVVTYRKGGSSSSQTRTARFDGTTNRWELAGSEADQVAQGPNAALAFQRGTLVQVISAGNGSPTQGRRFDGTRWSAFTPLAPVESNEARAVVRQDTLFIVYRHPAQVAGVARLNLP